MIPDIQQNKINPIVIINIVNRSILPLCGDVVVFEDSLYGTMVDVIKICVFSDVVDVICEVTTIIPSVDSVESVGSIESIVLFNGSLVFECGVPVGSFVGSVVGFLDGCGVGLIVGCLVGDKLGANVGDCDGNLVG